MSRCFEVHLFLYFFQRVLPVAPIKYLKVIFLPLSFFLVTIFENSTIETFNMNCVSGQSSDVLKVLYICIAVYGKNAFWVAVLQVATWETLPVAILPVYSSYIVSMVVHPSTPGAHGPWTWRISGLGERLASRPSDTHNHNSHQQPLLTCEWEVHATQVLARSGSFSSSVEMASHRHQPQHADGPTCSFHHSLIWGGYRQEGKHTRCSWLSTAKEQGVYFQCVSSCPAYVCATPKKSFELALLPHVYLQGQSLHSPSQQHCWSL